MSTNAKRRADFNSVTRRPKPTLPTTSVPKVARTRVPKMMTTMTKTSMKLRKICQEGVSMTTLTTKWPGARTTWVKAARASLLAKAWASTPRWTRWRLKTTTTSSRLKGPEEEIYGLKLIFNSFKLLLIIVNPLTFCSLFCLIVKFTLLEAII